MQNRLRHLLTIWRGVSKRAAMTSFARPWAANSTIFARMTSRYGDVYRRARTESASRSASVNWTRYGLILGMSRCPSPGEQRATVGPVSSSIIRHRIYEHEY